MDLDVVVVSTISNWLGQSEELSAVVNVSWPKGQSTFVRIGCDMYAPEPIKIPFFTGEVWPFVLTAF